ncbi:MAG: hypothetical protein QM770_01400 [Tepidisphaeraceae bacterium]
MSSENNPGNGGGGAVGGVIFLFIVTVVLGIFNPSEADLRERIARDGWSPVGFERTNLVVLSWVKVTGFTGAKSTYVGVCGGIFQIGGGK